MSMDAWQERQIIALRERKAAQIRRDIVKIRENAEYALRRVDSDNPEGVAEFADIMADAAGRVMLACAGLSTLDEALGILATTDEQKASTR